MVSIVRMIEFETGRAKIENAPQVCCQKRQA